jgi:hypothetical protein
MAQPMKICKGKKKEIQSFHNLPIIEAYMQWYKKPLRILVFSFNPFFLQDGWIHIPNINIYDMGNKTYIHVIWSSYLVIKSYWIHLPSKEGHTCTKWFL